MGQKKIFIDMKISHCVTFFRLCNFSAENEFNVRHTIYFENQIREYLEANVSVLEGST